MKFAFVGAGKMATALIKGMLAKSVCFSENIIAFSAGGEHETLASTIGITAARDNVDAVAQADVVLLCVKPNDSAAALEPLHGKLDGKLLISIVTGLSLARMAKLGGEGCRCVRVMPNTPVMVGAAACAYSVGDTATDSDAAVVRSIFGALGIIVQVDEDKMDAVTALSGSGPAYVYLMIEALTEAGVFVGLTQELAHELSTQTVAGAAKMVAETGIAPAKLREMVTSPNGTTAAALAVMESRNYRALVGDAVKAAANRSRELSKE